MLLFVQFVSMIVVLAVDRYVANSHDQEDRDNSFTWKTATRNDPKTEKTREKERITADYIRYYSLTEYSVVGTFNRGDLRTKEPSESCKLRGKF